MAIEFLCPNGHRISAPDDRVGRSARCPRCSVRLRVPGTSGDVAVAVEENTAAAGSGPALQAQAADSGELKLQEQEDDVITFLCPNGHRLTGPAWLQGKAGECPHCGEKFRIPFLSEADHFVGITSAAPADDSEALPMPEDTGGYSMHSPFHVPPLCALLRKLWEEKQHGAVIELHLDGGALMAPDWFDEHHSCETHGLFASQAADGTITMTAVAWDSISRVVVRNVEGMPEGMFE